MEAVQSREERATSCLESDIHPLISGWVHGDTANLKVKVLPPPTLAPALALPAPFQNPPLLGREKLESAPAIPPLLLRRGPEAGGSTFPWYLLPLPTAGQMWSHWTTLSLEAAQSRLLGVPALGNSAPGGKWILGLEKIQRSLENHSRLCCFVLWRWYRAGSAHIWKGSLDQTFDETLLQKQDAMPGLSWCVSPLVAWFWTYPPSLPQAHTLSASLSLSFALSHFLCLLLFHLFIFFFFLHLFCCLFSFFISLHPSLCPLSPHTLSPFLYDLQNIVSSQS